jgi:surfactin synthase thioesterase subunit
MVYSLFGDQPPSMTQKYLQVLDEDLSIALSVHNLYQQQIYLIPGQVSVPLLVCRGERDKIIDRNLWQGWESWMNRGDRLWECPKGLYFFHYSYPKKVSQQIQDFWQTLSCSSSASACQTSI